jgi:hypothetical protein
MKIQSNYNYLDPFADALNEGEWMTAAARFHLRGGSGQGWKDEGREVKAGQRFRLLDHGSPARPSVWETED